MHTSTSVEAAKRSLPVASGRILLAEDDTSLRELLATVLRESGYEVVEAADGQELLNLVVAALARSGSACDVDMIVADVKMPGQTGMDVLKLMRNARIGTPVILITAFGDAELHRAAYDLDAWVLDKPFDLEDLEEAVLLLLRRRSRAAERDQPPM